VTDRQKVKSKRGGKRNPPGGPVKGARLSIATREAIRGAVMLEILHKIAEGKIKQSPQMLAVRSSTALGLVKFQLPLLTAMDLTSGGLPLLVEQVRFKAPDAN